MAENKPFYLVHHRSVLDNIEGDLVTHKDNDTFGVLQPAVSYHLVSLLCAF
jgi:hypothetical protein